MTKLLRVLAYLVALVALFFGLAPLVAYGIRHAGVIGLLVYGGGLLLLLLVWKRMQGRWGRRLRMLAAIGFAGLFLVGTAVSVWMAGYAYFTPPTPNATVIVLGCQVVGDRPSKMLRLRLDAAYDYLLANPESVVIGSGGRNDGGSMSEAAVMQKDLIARGIAPERIFIEDRSRSTKENLAFSDALIQSNHLPTNVAIASDGFHQLRAAIYANQHDLQPSPLSAPTPWGLFPGYWVREWFALAKQALLD